VIAIGELLAAREDRTFAACIASGLRPRSAAIASITRARRRDIDLDRQRLARAESSTSAFERRSRAGVAQEVHRPAFIGRGGDGQWHARPSFFHLRSQPCDSQTVYA